MSECPAVDLGVHASIGPDNLPLYVSRDFDSLLWERLQAATRDGGLVLLVGGSSVGKTRSAYEAVRAVMPSWRLLLGDDTAGLRNLGVLPHWTLLWLDDLDRHLSEHGGGGLTAEDLRRLLGMANGDGRSVAVATMWPRPYQRLAALPSEDSGTGDIDADPYRDARQLVALAGEPIHVPEQFSATERGRAKAVSSTDERIAVALKDPDFGVTQVLAGAPELIRRWTLSPDYYTRALITAGLDARRLGARAPLGSEFLRRSAAAYLSDTQRAAAPADWFDAAMAYCLEPLNGATSVLLPCAGDDTAVGVVVGYGVADYLVQHAEATRRGQPVPPGLWAALADAPADADVSRLARNAFDRSLYHLAEPLLRRAAAAGDDSARWRLARMHALQQRLTELRERAMAGDRHARIFLVRVLARDGREEELRELAAGGDPVAGEELAALLSNAGRMSEAIELLGTMAAGGDDGAGRELVVLLGERGDTAELERLAQRGDVHARLELIGLAAESGQVDEAEAQLQAMAEAGILAARWQLAGLLLDQGYTEEAVDQLQALARAHHDGARRQLIAMLGEMGDVEALRKLADLDDDDADEQIVRVLEQTGRVHEALGRLERAAAAGSAGARRRKAAILERTGKIHEAIAELRTLAAAGDGAAHARLIGLLAREQRMDELSALAAASDTVACRRLAEEEIKAGAVDAALARLRTMAEHGDSQARLRVDELLAQRGDLQAATDDLRQMTIAADEVAPRRLTELLNQHGLHDEARQITRLGLEPDGRTAKQWF